MERMTEQQTRQASQMLRHQQDRLAERIVARQYALQPDRWESLGNVGREKSVRDVGYHLSYLAEAVAARDPLLLEDYIDWVQVLFDGLGFSGDVLQMTLGCAAEVLREELEPGPAALPLAYLDRAKERLLRGPTPTTSFLSADAPPAKRELMPVAEQYLDALLSAERGTASRLILSAVDEGVSVKDVYLYVFQPVQREIGRLWQTNQISVAQEHYCTAATQMIMSQLYPRIFGGQRRDRRLVATCVSGELHELGVRMIADFFELEGWDTYYLGANTPTPSIAQAVVEQQADVLAISATITFHVAQVQDVIEHVRASGAGQHVRIIVGGYPFNVSSTLWQTVDADGYARDAQEAVAVANRWLERRDAA
jgi:methanogenic corrinoid protein MtbC1